jgi:hypothetical protein
MKRYLPLLFVAALFAACGAAAGPTATPQHTPTSAPPSATPIDVPSSSCIFILDIDNQSSGTIRVEINDTPVATLAPQTSRRFMDLGGWPEMPWFVVLVRTSDGATLGESTFTSDQLEGHMTARDQRATASSKDCAPG